MPVTQLPVTPRTHLLPVGLVLVWLAVACMGCSSMRPPARTTSPSMTEAADGPSALSRFRLRQAETTDDPAAYYRPWVAVLPFADESGFRNGVWDLHNEPARLLASEMGRSTAWRVVPYAAVQEVIDKHPRRWDDARLRQLADTLGADMLITGDLLDYNMERLSVGDPLIGGYKAYKGIAELEIQLTRGSDLQRIGNAHAHQETVDRGLGLDLLGKPRAQDYQFVNLAQMEYGAEEFRGTAIGQATVSAMDKLIQQLTQLVRPQGIQVSAGMAQILSAFGQELFINIGSENGVHKGYRFAVYPGQAHEAELDPDARIGIVEVQDVIGARVSRVTALAGVDAISIGDRLELIGIDPEQD